VIRASDALSVAIRRKPLTPQGVRQTLHRAREKFAEAHDLIIKSWTTDGPFSWDGKHYRFRYINV